MDEGESTGGVCLLDLLDLLLFNKDPQTLHNHSSV